MSLFSLWEYLDHEIDSYCTHVHSRHTRNSCVHSRHSRDSTRTLTPHAYTHAIHATHATRAFVGAAYCKVQKYPATFEHSPPLDTPPCVNKYMFTHTVHIICTPIIKYRMTSTLWVAFESNPVVIFKRSRYLLRLEESQTFSSHKLAL
jgi:hypothetical protein